MAKSSNSITIPKPLIKKKGVVILPLAEFERFKEDLKILQSKKLHREIRKAREEIKQGKVFTLEEIGKELGL